MQAKQEDNKAVCIHADRNSVKPCTPFRIRCRYRALRVPELEDGVALRNI